MKFIILLVLALSAFALTDKEILQEVFNGLFEQNKLPKPTTIVPCFDDSSAAKTVKFAGTVLDKASRGSLNDLLALPDLIKKFGEDLDPNVKKCLEGNQELEALGPKYNPKNLSDDEIKKKVITYVTLHYLTVHKWLGELDDLWHHANYYQVGFKGAGYGHNVLGLSTESSVEAVKEFAVKRVTKHVLTILEELKHLKHEFTI